MRIRFLVLSTLLLWPSSPSFADEVFVATLPDVRTTSIAIGAATFTLRSDLSAIDYVVTYAELSSPEIYSHVHRKLGPIAHDLPLGSPKVGTWNAPTAEDIAQLRNEELYVNIHSGYYPGGEIQGTLRKQALPVAPTTWGAIKALYR
jgi:hypothetical protein